jgi:hypothetical protein
MEEVGAVEKENDEVIHRVQGDDVGWWRSDSLSRDTKGGRKVRVPLLEIQPERETSA